MAVWAFREGNKLVLADSEQLHDIVLVCGDSAPQLDALAKACDLINAASAGGRGMNKVRRTQERAMNYPSHINPLGWRIY